VPKRALPGLVEIERVHVEARLAAQIRARHQHVHFQEFVTQVFSKAAHAIAPVALHDRDLVAFDFPGEHRWSVLRRTATARMTRRPQSALAVLLQPIQRGSALHALPSLWASLRRVLVILL